MDVSGRRRAYERPSVSPETCAKSFFLWLKKRSFLGFVSQPGARNMYMANIQLLA